MKYFKSLLLSLLIATAFTSTANAEAPRPISENEAFIKQHAQEVEKKEGILLNTSQELQELERKKAELARKLEAETKTIEELKTKLEEKRAAAEAEKKRLAEIKNMFVHVTRYAGNSAGNLYAPGNCTWYVKDRRPDLPNNLGNANTWYSNAAAMGWNVGSTPKKGAVGTTTAGWAGHVVYVEGVSLDGQYVTISEMNYRGLYNMNTRTVHFSEFNYIYELE